MNKSKLMYDMVKALQKKEVFIGELKVSGTRADMSLVDLTHAFEKNTLSGVVKCDLKVEADVCGKKIKHQSKTEFNMNSKECCDSKHHGHSWHKFHGQGHGHHPGHGCHGSSTFKDKLTALSFLLQLLNQIEIDEQADKSIKLALRVNELPADLQELIMAKMKDHTCEEKSGPHSSYMQELFTMKDVQFSMNMLISPERDLKKSVITIKGKQMNESGQAQDCNLTIELNLD